MFRYKGFDSAAVGDDMAKLEAVVNDWMQHQQPRVRLMAQSARGEHIVVSFVYEMGSDPGHERARKVAIPEVFERQFGEAELDPDEVEDPSLPEADLPY
jgi:hypothetical protein